MDTTGSYHWSFVNMRRVDRIPCWRWTASWAVAWLLVGSGAALAAVPELVGVLAIAVEEDVAAQLDLSDDQREKLRGFMERREADALPLVQQARSLPEAERNTRLAEFRAASEKDGLKLLSDTQREKLLEIAKNRESGGDAAPIDAPPGEQAPDDRPMPQPADESEETADVASPDRATDPQPTVWAEGEPPEPDFDEPPGRYEIAAEPPPSGKLRFSFRYQPWKDVLDWFAEQADLSLAIDAPPPGTFNYSDPREYTPAEAIDLLNSVLLTKGYTLVRRNRMLMLINLEDGIPPNLVDQVAPEELDDRGAYELVSTLFVVSQMSPEEAENEISKLLGPQGSLVVMPKAGMIKVTETAGRLRMIRKVINAVEDPQGTLGAEVHQFELKNATADEVLPIVRQLLNFPEEQNAAADGSLRVAIDPSGTRLLATGKEQRVTQLEEILKVVDVAGDAFSETDLGPIEMPQLEVYTISAADPDSVLQVMQTLLAGETDVRLATDPKTGNLVALARPSQHATIKATLDQMQRDARQIDVFHLATVDPQLAVLAINKLFGADGETPSRTAPKVEADPISRTLLVRANDAQMEQIRGLLVKMGETEPGAETATSGGNVRMLPVEGRAARAALEQIQELWPTMRQNRIRVVAPSRVIPTYRPSGPESEVQGPSEPPSPRRPAPPEQPADNGAGQPVEEDPTARSARRVPAMFVAQPAPSQPPKNQDNKPPADIIVAPGPNGTMIASDDLEALDDFESLLTSIANRSASGQEMAVFYLKYAKATTVAETLQNIFGGGAAAGGGGGGGGGGLLGDIAGAALGDLGGGLFGGLLGGGGGGLTTAGTVEIVADARLNALVVQAKAADLDLVEQLLEILDQETSPEEVQVASRPKLIPVYNTSADEVATVVRQVYQDRMVGSNSSRQRQPSPDEFIRALRGGRGGRGGSSNSAESEVQKLSLGVDPRSNSLIVAAPEPLFSEVETLVAKLDVAITTSTETTRVITLKRTNPAAMGQALSSILGDQVTTGTTDATSDQPAVQPPAGRDNGNDRDDDSRRAEEFRRRIEFFQRMRRDAEQGGRGGDRGPGRGGERGGESRGPRGR